MMFERLKSTVAGFRDQSEPVEMTESHLFRCDSCKTVYIDTKKQSCPQCGVAVERIAADGGESEPPEPSN